MAGLSAARALSDHFARVTIVERDTLPHAATLESRKGVPQGNHGHGLLASGYRVLDAYFPNMMRELMAEGVPHGDISGDFIWHQFFQYRFPANRLRHYEKMTRFPGGYLVIGDAICSFNPIYGQGMSVAFCEAKALDECVAAGDQDLARRFFKRAHDVAFRAWTIAAGEDLRFPEVEGERAVGSALIHKYMERMHRVAAKDPIVLRRFFEVGNLLIPPTAMLAPSIAWRVLSGGRGEAQASPAQKRASA